ncbi:hypothetical protein D9M69_638420 [compost metagenome]
MVCNDIRERIIIYYRYKQSRLAQGDLMYLVEKNHPRNGKGRNLVEINDKIYSPF